MTFVEHKINKIMKYNTNEIHRRTRNGRQGRKHWRPLKNLHQILNWKEDNMENC